MKNKKFITNDGIQVTVITMTGSTVIYYRCGYGKEKIRVGRKWFEENTKEMKGIATTK